MGEYYDCATNTGRLHRPGGHTLAAQLICRSSLTTHPCLARRHWEERIPRLVRDDADAVAITAANLRGVGAVDGLLLHADRLGQEVAAEVLHERLFVSILATRGRPIEAHKTDRHDRQTPR